jgi:hypothetical protein
MIQADPIINGTKDSYGQTTLPDSGYNLLDLVQKNQDAVKAQQEQHKADLKVVSDNLNQVLTGAAPWDIPDLQKEQSEVQKAYQWEFAQGGNPLDPENKNYQALQDKYHGLINKVQQSHEDYVNYTAANKYAADKPKDFDTELTYTMNGHQTTAPIGKRVFKPYDAAHDVDADIKDFMGKYQDKDIPSIYTDKGVSHGQRLIEEDKGYTPRAQAYIGQHFRLDKPKSGLKFDTEFAGLPQPTQDAINAQAKKWNNENPDDPPLTGQDIYAASRLNNIQNHQITAKLTDVPAGQYKPPTKEQEQILQNNEYGVGESDNPQFSTAVALLDKAAGHALGTSSDYKDNQPGLNGNMSVFTNYDGYKHSSAYNMQNDPNGLEVPEMKPVNVNGKPTPTPTGNKKVSPNFVYDTRYNKDKGRFEVRDGLSEQQNGVGAYRAADPLFDIELPSLKGKNTDQGTGGNSGTENIISGIYQAAGNVGALRSDGTIDYKKWQAARSKVNGQQSAPANNAPTPTKSSKIVPTIFQGKPTSFNEIHDDFRKQFGRDMSPTEIAKAENKFGVKNA